MLWKIAAVYRVQHKKNQTIVHEKEEPLVKQLTAGHTDVIYVNGIELRTKIKATNANKIRNEQFSTEWQASLQKDTCSTSKPQNVGLERQ